MKIIITSTGPRRVGAAVGAWFAAIARERGGLEVEVLDLAEIDLPFMNEPHHPRLRQYTHQHTKDWSEAIESGDAYEFVVPEYNFGINAPMKNALDFLVQEWSHKPVGFVSYGGVSGGLRAVQMAKQIVTTIKMVPIFEGVAIPFVHANVRQDGVFEPVEPLIAASAKAMLDELTRYAATLAPLRDPA
ncbi:MAG: NAD(P)H-dependent oxidoreductase [Nocardioides sp.]